MPTLVVMEVTRFEGSVRYVIAVHFVNIPYFSHVLMVQLRQRRLRKLNFRKDACKIKKNN